MSYPHITARAAGGVISTEINHLDADGQAVARLKITAVTAGETERATGDIEQRIVIKTCILFIFNITGRGQRIGFIIVALTAAEGADGNRRAEPSAFSSSRPSPAVSTKPE